MLLKNAHILNDQFSFISGDLRMEAGKITGIGSLAPLPGEAVSDLEGCFLIPGLVETHFHGAMGHSTEEATSEMLDAFSRFEASRGITSFVPGLSSSPDAVTEAFLRVSAEYMKHPQPGAKMHGVYLEGPFISYERRGGHLPEMLQKPDAEKLRSWHAMSGGIIKKTITAPELKGAEAFIRTGAELGIVMEIGHSVASYEQALEAIGWGARLATHTFNGMNPFNHRQPGVLGAVLTDARIDCELIADFGHVSPAGVKLAYLAKGEDHINIVSDSMMAAGLGDGIYSKGDGKRKTIVKDGLSRTEDGVITGSACTIMEGLRNLVSIGIPLESAVKMCAYNPARTLGLEQEIGSIACGKCADLVALRPDLSIAGVWIDGQKQ